MCIGYFLVLLDVTVINVALPQIGSGLGSDVSGLQWVVDGYALALAALLLTGGTVGDLRGHKPVVMAGLAVFGVASLACGLAPTTQALIGARVAQGVGAALLLPGTLAIISQAFPGRAEQARAIGVWAGVGSLALPAGPVLGGALVQGLGWRWVFFLNVPIVLAAGIVAFRIVGRDAPTKGGRLDRGGTVLGAVFLAAVTFAVIQAGHTGLDVATGSAIAVAAVALVGFVLVERSAADPALPVHLFGQRAFAAANGVAGIMNLGTLGLLFLLTLFLQTLQHRSALAAGVAVLPLFLPLALLAPVTGRVTARLGPRLPMLAGLLLCAVGVGLVATWTATTPYLHLVPGMLGWGIGLSLLTPAVVAAAVAASPSDRAGLASGVNNTARQTGGAIGIAVYGAIAGQPGHADRFLTGLHTTALVTAGLFGLAAAATALAIPSRPGRQVRRQVRRR
ncbi:MAG: MFS transporter [Pseudonocardiales bacterium]|nr:MAG: MFS transporter [Pseudonocardiales bacterium]